jgi:hypothetical protein
MEVPSMMAMISMLVVSAVFVGPLVWRLWQDRRQAEADRVGADVRAVINRRLRGESFVAVRVAAPSPWRTGRVVLSVPAGYEFLVEAAWRGVVRRLPSRYELVLAAGDRREASAPPDAARLARAA